MVGIDQGQNEDDEAARKVDNETTQGAIWFACHMVTERQWVGES